MKLVYGKQAYDSLTKDSQAKLTPVPCKCVDLGIADDDCDTCMGGGVMFEDRTISADDMRAILDNLRSQGVPMPKDEGTQ